MSSVRQQILDTAERLFFAQGYIDTGINQLISESGVARRTFYHHFPSKESVGVEYVVLTSERTRAGIRAALKSRRSAAGAVRSLFEWAEEVAKSADFRGCGVLNMAAEFAQAGSEMRALVKQKKEAQAALIVDLLGALGVSQATARQIDVLFEGATASASAHLDVQPIRAAMHAALALVDRSRS